MKICQILKEYCENVGLSFREDYRGRGQFRDCCGIVTDSVMSTLVDICDYLHFNEVDDLGSALGTPQYDSLGMDYILYFPKVRWEDSEEEDEDEYEADSEE